MTTRWGIHRVFAMPSININIVRVEYRQESKSLSLLGRSNY